jgi:hypothetical protein
MEAVDRLQQQTRGISADTATAWRNGQLPAEPLVTGQSLTAGGEVTKQNGGGSGGGGFTGYQMNTRWSVMRLSYNGLSSASVDVSSPATFGSSLLNPGSQTQSINLFWKGTLGESTQYDRLVDAVADILDGYERPTGKPNEGHQPCYNKLKARFVSGIVPSDAKGFRPIASKIIRFYEAHASQTTPSQNNTPASNNPPQVQTSLPADVQLVWGPYFNVGFSQITFTNGSKSSASGSLIFPSLGVETQYGDVTDPNKLHFGLQVGATARWLSGSVPYDMVPKGIRRVLGIEARVFAQYGSGTLYIQYTRMAGTLPSFSASQVTFGTQINVLTF